MNLSADTDTVDLIRERSGIFGSDIELITYQFCIFSTAGTLVVVTVYRVSTAVL